MSLIKCQECGAEISDLAKACPKCGAPTEQTPAPSPLPPKPPTWGIVPGLACVAGGIIALLNGINLITVQAMGPNSLIEAAAHGVGWLAIGGGLFMIALPLYISSAVNTLWSKGRSLNYSPVTAGSGTASQRTTPVDGATLAKEYGISFDGQQYVYGGYRYDRLSDAIAYAQKQSKDDNDF